MLHQIGANTVDGATYTYDNAGNRNSKQNLLNAVTENYAYDKLRFPVSTLVKSRCIVEPRPFFFIVTTQLREPGMEA